MANYRISKKAQLDLIGIWDYTVSEWSIKQANRYLKSLLKAFDYISKNPEMGKACDDIKIGYFKFPKESHLIFYRRASNSMVDIVRILHKRSDIYSKF